MGLDMYLDAEAYLSTFDFEGTGEAPAARAQKTLIAASFEVPLPIKTIRMPVAYWRKANAIHKWFVDTVQNGVDDCRSYYVTREQIKDLLKETKKALKAYEKNPEEAGKILPPQSGFFFGSTDLDDWYVEDLKITVEQLEKALSLPEDLDFYYHSSW